MNLEERLAEEEEPEQTFPTAFQRKALWSSLTGVALFVIGAIVVVILALTGRVLSFLSPVLIPLAVSAIMAFLLDPVVRKVQGRKISRNKAILIVLSLVVAAITLFGLLVIPPAIKDVSKLANPQKREALIGSISTGLEKLQSHPVFSPVVTWLAADPTPTVADPNGDDATTTVDDPELPESADENSGAQKASPQQVAKKEPKNLTWKDSRLLNWLEGNGGMLGKKVLAFVQASGSTLLGMVGTLIGLVMTPIFVFYFLRDSDSIKQNWHQYLPLRASSFKDEIVDTLKEINSYLIAFFRGQVLVSMIDGILTGIALKALGLPYAISIGLALAVLGIMPFIGIILTFIPAALIALGHFGDWQHVLYVALIFFAIQQIDGFLIQPKIVGDSVGLHPLTVIFSVLLWSLLLGGFIGALLAVPLTAAVKVLFRRYIWERRFSPDSETQILV